ncbi:hypothetical protein NDU88_000444 [Pleurodeles waltl]|uniref:Uncharacterized protein n=1 Tax=Pleurodeles waltl TaxID=8319 RepID=A0AAV7UQI3_PLEWA|nr:hypothetical protein NDU88_000444 [Pleurodeles waltl]
MPSARQRRVHCSDRINNKWHPRKQRRQLAASPLTWIPLKMSAGSDAKKEVGSNRPKPRRQAADGTAEILCRGIMACNRSKVGKRKGRDPELSQLLKLVLAKLGNGDSDSGNSASDGENNCAESDRPRRSHGTPRAAFPPVKRISKKQVSNTHQAAAAPTSTPLPAQSPRADTLAVSLCTTPEVPPVEQRAVPMPELGVLAILTDIRQTLATLTVPPVLPVVQTAVQMVPPTALQGQGSSTAQVPTQDTTT